LPSKNDPSDQPEPQALDLFSTHETRAMLEEFRDLVRAGILRVTPENEVLPGKEPPVATGAEKPAHPPASREGEVALLDRQLLDWLERRKQQKAEQARQTRQAEETAPAEQAGESLLGNLRQKVIDAVARRILETWERAEQSSDPLYSLRAQVIDRAAEHLLRRLQRNPE
jgi:hypothetical protein